MAKVKGHVFVSCEDENINLGYVPDFDLMSSYEEEWVNSHRSTCVNNSYNTVVIPKMKVGVDCDEDGNMESMMLMLIGLGKAIFFIQNFKFNGTSSIQPD